MWTLLDDLEKEMHNGIFVLVFSFILKQVSFTEQNQSRSSLKSKILNEMNQYDTKTFIQYHWILFATLDYCLNL